MRKLLVSALIGLLVLFSTLSVINAQDDSSWVISPQSFIETDTAEIDTGIHVTFSEDDCIFVVILPGSESSDVPRESKLSIQKGNDRYSTTLALVAGKQLSRCISPMKMGLDNPETGAIDYNKLFKPSMGEVRNILLHFQDEKRSSNLVVTHLTVIHAENGGKQVEATPPASSIPVGTKLCVQSAFNLYSSGEDEYADFKGDLSDDKYPEIKVIVEGKKYPVGTKLDAYYKEGNFTRIYISTVMGWSHSPTDFWVVTVC